MGNLFRKILSLKWLLTKEKTMVANEISRLKSILGLKMFGGKPAPGVIEILIWNYVW